MPDIELTKNQIPFWFANSGILQVKASVTDINSPIPFENKDIFSINLNVSGGSPIKIGEIDTVKLDFNAGVSSRLLPLWENSEAERLKMLEGYLPNDYLTRHPDQVVLLLMLGEQAGVGLDGHFTYQIINAGASLKAGQDASYRLVRAFDAQKPLKEIIPDFFRGFRLPANIDDSLEEGEVIAFEYGGYLDVGGSVGIGYELSGSKGFQIEALDLAEKYDFSLMAKLAVGASIAGRFRIVASRGPSGPDWVRVQVRKARQHQFSIAADIKATADFETKNMPTDADEFISSIFGLKAKNWLNMFDQIKSYSDFDELEEKLDTLAKTFVEKYIGKAFDQLKNHAEFTNFIAEVGRIAHAYVELENHAITLFDRYFNMATGLVDEKLTEILKFIKNAVNLEDIEKKLDEVTDNIWFDVLEQLTEGNLLEWLTGSARIGDDLIESTFEELKKRVDKALSLIEDAAHDEIRRIIAIAKREFPLDEFITKLDGVTADKLQQWTNNFANKKLVAFFERLVGKTFDELKNSNLGKAVTQFNQVLVKIDEFKKETYDQILASLKQNFEFELHYAYNKATENEVLFDVEINIKSDLGKVLMKFAGNGEFDRLMKHYHSGHVKLIEAKLLHSITRSSKTSINIVGWKRAWHYEKLTNLVIQSKQRILPEAGGGLMMLADFELKNEREIKKNKERVYTNLLLSFFGESKGNLVLDSKSKKYLVDRLTGIQASYQLVFDDENTTPGELAQYLSFADDFGLIGSDEAAFAAMTNLLPADANGNYGKVSVEYKVKFTEDGLKLLFQSPLDEDNLRFILRMNVLSNYVLDKAHTSPAIGWAYWTPGIYKIWKTQGFATFIGSDSSIEFKPVAPYPGLPYPSGGRVRLSKFQRNVLSTLYLIEDDVVKAMKKLDQVLRSGDVIKPSEFEDKLGDFGKVLKRYDGFDEGENTIFFLFDNLIKNAAKNLPLGSGAFRKSSLKITSRLAGETEDKTKMLIA